jgi:hypothetical protein
MVLGGVGGVKSAYFSTDDPNETQNEEAVGSGASGRNTSGRLSEAAWLDGEQASARSACSAGAHCGNSSRSAAGYRGHCSAPCTLFRDECRVLAEASEFLRLGNFAAIGSRIANRNASSACCADGGKISRQCSSLRGFCLKLTPGGVNPAPTKARARRKSSGRAAAILRRRFRRLWIGRRCVGRGRR